MIGHYVKKVCFPGVTKEAEKRLKHMDKVVSSAVGVAAS